jgi:alkanesulfonate monooxygenase SsuD/methylene tetrahydromethanopterin reductase-like flavin-dependent oxidoreductase (luciferase family)
LNRLNATLTITTRPGRCTPGTPRCSAALLATWNPAVAGALFLLPLWNPVLVAEQIGTLAALSEGRFVMQGGIGAGRAQFAAMGVDVTDRGRLFEHHLAVVRALLAGVEVDGVRIATVPAEPVDVWIGATARAGSPMTG